MGVAKSSCSQLLPVANSRAAFGLADDSVNPAYTEWARHNAWLAQARIGTLLEELSWTENTQWLADQLRQAIAPIERAIPRLERGSITREAQLEMYDNDDITQMTTPRFEPSRADTTA
jgi:hypothetical protein